ncbi:hypothetical protein [Phycicoccus sp. DTK01]|uniref:hypothetical protein n=1 Tax=Phycicoccus sp. DTK01 TaxID=2785745 RepID=UPI001A8CDA79|nr:hypothetical protein [Phycicoccus sp. DTK01]GIL37726.1 hypothetical protein PDTK01_38010 [Phycicoccus sp. DTK01]
MRRALSVTALAAVLLATPAATTDMPTPAETKAPRATVAAKARPKPTPAALSRKHARDYRFLHGAVHGRPKAVWPCRTIIVALNRRGLPAHTARDLREAVRRVSRASGYRFKVVYTRAVPTRAGHHPGGGAPQVLIASARPGVRGFDDPLAAATAEVQPLVDNAHWRLSTSVVLVNTQAHLRPGFAVDGMASVLAHELGHTLGLDHVPSRTQQLMGPYGAPGLGAGDIAGLRRLHRASCG